MEISRVNKRRSRSSKNRKADATLAIANLSETLSGHLDDKKIADSAARDIIRVGRRHGKRADPEISRMICRKCFIALSPGQNSRIRIVSKKIITTCTICGKISKTSPRDSI
ncbi:MAG: hypothetical protein CMB58_006005 [Methanobacteriota archaeon]|nr:MAG: hypothetical protein CMB58_006005 [Euryarchaeota archaeon]